MTCWLDSCSILGEPFDSTKYRQTIGSFTCLTACTSSYIGLALGWLSQCIDQPATELWASIESIIRYLGGSSIKRILFDVQSAPPIQSALQTHIGQAVNLTAMLKCEQYFKHQQWSAPVTGGWAVLQPVMCLETSSSIPGWWKKFWVYRNGHPCFNVY